MTRIQETATARPDLLELPLEAWEPTKTTLHLWAQIVGKVKLAATTPPQPLVELPIAKGETRGMSFEKTPSGTRGARAPSRSNAFTRFIGRMMIKFHRRSGDRFRGMDLLYLTTVGAKTGQKRQTPLARFPDGDGSWLVVASLGGSARNPGWYHNIAAHPDQVWIEVAGHQLRVTAEQLDGEPREVAWQRIVESQPRYAGYQRKTDRVLPILRLSPAQNP
jgi:deazaflavin-dependent oxidoreductase (nitroreductase family)